MSTSMTQRIAKLLSLAENAGNEAEAHAAFAKAQELASAYQIDLELARRAAAPKQRETPIKKTIHIGAPGTHANKPLINLFLRVGDANDVSCLISSRSTYVIAHGMPSDVEMTEMVWASLVTAMVKFGKAHVDDKDAAWRSETVTIWNPRTWQVETKKISKQSARRSFYDAFTSRIAIRLQEARRESIKQADATHFHNDSEPVAAITATGDGNLPSSMALVLKEKKAEVDQFMDEEFRRTYGRAPRGGWKGGSNSQWSVSSGAAGRAAADRVNLNGRRGIAS